MALRKTVEIKGLDTLERRLRRLDHETRAAAQDGSLLAAAEVIREEVERTAPRSDTPGGSTGRGHAADHIEKRVVQAGRFRESQVGPEKPFWYLIFPEFGTPSQPAKAPFRRAARRRFRDAVAAYVGEMRQQVLRAIR